MLERGRFAEIARLTVPVTIAVSSTLVMSLIDLIMVAPLGTQATAATGLAAIGYGLALAFVAGLAPAVQGIAARRRGAGAPDAGAAPANAGITAAVLVGTPLTLACYLLAPWFFSLAASDAQVSQIGVQCLRMLSLSLVASGVNLTFKGLWTGLGTPRTYMKIVLFMSVLNFMGNWVLITGRFGAPALGAPGAALSTTLSIGIGMMLNLAIGQRRLASQGLLRRMPDRALLARVGMLGAPATVQEFMFSAGFVAFFALVGRIGTTELAVASVLVRVSMVLFVLAMSLGNTAATLVCKAVGEGDLDEAARWGWDTAKLGIVVLTGIGLPMLIFPREFLGLFLASADAVSMGIAPLRLQSATIGMGSLIYIFAYTLVSLGDGNRVALISFSTQWLFFLPLVWLVGPYLRYGLLEIWLVQTIYGAIATALITSLWVGGRWKTIKA
jgi:putative MATE family efflux protein